MQQYVVEQIVGMKFREVGRAAAHEAERHLAGGDEDALPFQHLGHRAEWNEDRRGILIAPVPRSCDVETPALSPVEAVESTLRND